jgi:hypothetical protein
MASIDWIIVTLYCGVLIVVAWAFHRRAGHSIDAYFVADRKLPWWIIGLSDTAAYTGGGPAFLMVFFLGGFSGFWIMGGSPGSSGWNGKPVTDPFPKKYLYDRPELHERLGEYLRGLSRPTSR